MRVNIFNSNGREWKRHRRIANPGYHRSWSTVAFDELFSKIIKQIEENRLSVNVTDFMPRMALDAPGKVIFDCEFKATENQHGSFVDLYNELLIGANKLLYSMFPILDSIPFIRREMLFEKVALFDRFIYGLIEEKAENLCSKHVDQETAEMGTLMLQASEEEKLYLTSEEIRNDVVEFLLASHDTTANALSVAIYYLGDECKDICPSFEQQQNDMPFIITVIRESMRLCPPVAVLPPRRTARTLRFREYVIPTSTNTRIHLYGLHHNPNVWKNPYKFDPERFLYNKSCDLFSWSPFVGGVRRCISMTFLMIEQRVVLSMLLRKFIWRFPDDSIHRTKL
ncbi:hypothetical protein K7432_015252 [Basidiobolus ranarum]|uniref:Cytochrome P450 n=1 Tax=Basidiobolus ranarum TaxID=34480 RepID=A0ABR2WGF9_9FUNG